MSPWGWESRGRLLKQVKSKPTQKRPNRWDNFVLPGPAHYEPPEIFCGPGFSKIKRAPAYSFGLYTPFRCTKPAAKPNAMQYNISGMTRKGIAKSAQGIIAERCDIPGDKTSKPGPGAYTPKPAAYLKRAPAYTMRIGYKPPYEAWDMWTPPPNMYRPPMMVKKPPAYSLQGRYKRKDDNKLPGPGDHDPKFDKIQMTNPSFSFGRNIKRSRNIQIPAPNAYCEKRLMYGKKSSPAPSFGIQHSKYLGKFTAYEIPSRLEMLAKDLA